MSHATNVSPEAADHGGNEKPRNPIGKALDGRAAALRFTYHAHNLGKYGFAADAFGPHQHGARAVYGCAYDARSRRFFHRHRLAGQHRLIDRALAFQHHAVDRNFFSRTHAQPVAHLHLIERNVAFGAAVFDEARHSRRKIEQRTKRAAGLSARAQLQYLPYQNQNYDCRRRLEIDRRLSVVSAQRGWKNSRQQGGQHAVSVRGPYADADQGEHVGAAQAERIERPFEKRQAAPDYNRAGQQQLDPRHQVCPDRMRQRRRHVRHGERQQRHAQPERQFEPMTHVAEFGVFQQHSGCGSRPERHATDRTRARLVAHHFRMHWADILDLDRRKLDRLRLQSHAADRTDTGAALPYLRVHRTGINCWRRGSGLGRLGGRVRSRLVVRCGCAYGGSRGSNRLWRGRDQYPRRALLAWVTDRGPPQRLLLRLLGRDSAQLHHAAHASRFVGRVQVLLRISCKALAAAGIAEEIRVPLMHVAAAASRSGVHHHPANRIFAPSSISSLHVVHPLFLRQVSRPMRFRRLLKNAPKQRARRYRMCNPEVKRTRYWELVLPKTCFSAAC